jgi:hypothetical protein
MENKIDFKSLFESIKDDRDEELKSYEDEGIQSLYKTIMPKYWESFKNIKDVMISHQLLEKKLYGIILEMYIRDLQISDELAEMHLKILEKI